MYCTDRTAIIKKEREREREKEELHRHSSIFHMKLWDIYTGVSA